MNKRSRGGRTRLEQYNKMIDFFLENKGLADGKFSTIHGQIKASQKWAELAKLLNSVNGAEKSAAQWQVAWRDLKSRTSLKARQRRKGMAATGNIKATLTELEQRVLSLLGMDYVKGSSQCFKIIPEDDNLQMALEDENTVVSNEAEVQTTELTTLKNDVDMPNPMRANKRNAEHENAGDNFAKIATHQAETMLMQAEAAKIHAESAKLQAEAMLLQAQAFDRVASSLEKLTNDIRIFIKK
ncbi:uncharacterized protein LOC128858324 [Anastrepha ludens]|uniref:uncharacterized protein LOC128858324 n=1 Tax=Anastrepha ludens TaxID=28586 RepID=UPI0023B0FF51|nr:uncharacterized protein LOC128858324 [Anastrepha ludens]